MTQEKVGTPLKSWYYTSKASSDDNGTTTSTITSSTTAITRSSNAYIYRVGAVAVLALDTCSSSPARITTKLELKEKN